uniref:Uncharacterized protein n=1 Tax=viral metagenome TaxID=1070528 RepID=A0A6H1ZUX3_9ZZZZ
MANLPVEAANGSESKAVALTAQGALENIKKNYPTLSTEVSVLEALVRKDILSLGTDEVFSLRDGDGEIRAFKQALVLSQKAGTLIQPVPGGDFCISAQGYEVWQEAAGACVIFPSEVLVDGKWQANPAVIRDQKTNRILMIYARAVAFRFSSKGIPMVSDWTTIYDTPSYRMIDLLGKAKQFPQAFKLLPTEIVPEKDKGTWAKYPFDEATNLWMNTSHDEALKWLAQIINREKKCLDFAQTFAKRNSLKHLSGLQKAPGVQWTIPVICWRPISGNIIKWDATQYAQLQAKVGKMISGDRKEFGQVEIQAGAERVSDDITSAVLEATTDPEDQVIDIPVDVKTEVLPEPKASATRQKKETGKTPGVKVHPAIANLEVAQEQFPEEYLAVCQALGIEPDADIRVPEALKIMAGINAIVDKANA